MKHIMTIKKRNSGTVYLIFKNTSGDLMVRRQGTITFRFLNGAPKYIQNFVNKNIGKEIKGTIIV